MRIQAPHVFAQKLIPQEFFPACIGFVPGGTVKHFMTSSGCSMEGALPREEMVPTVLGVAKFRN